MYSYIVNTYVGCCHLKWICWKNTDVQIWSLMLIETQSWLCRFFWKYRQTSFLTFKLSQQIYENVSDSFSEIMSLIMFVELKFLPFYLSPLHQEFACYHTSTQFIIIYVIWNNCSSLWVHKIWVSFLWNSYELSGFPTHSRK